MLHPEVLATSNTSVPSSSTNTPHTIPNWSVFPLSSGQLLGDCWEINSAVKMDTACYSVYVGGTWKKPNHSFLFEVLESQLASDAFLKQVWTFTSCMCTALVHLHTCSRACMLESNDVYRYPHDTSDWKSRLHPHGSVIGLHRGRAAH